MALFFYCLFSITKVKHSDEKEVGKYREANDYLPPDRSVFTFCVLSSEAPSAAVPLCVCVCVCDRFKCVSNHQVHIFLSGLDFYYKSHVCWKKNLTVIETQKLKTAALHTAKLQHLLLISTKKTNVHPPQQVAPVCKVLLVPPSSRGQS